MCYQMVQNIWTWRKWRRFNCWSLRISNDLSTNSRSANHIWDKVVCAFPMFISTDFRMVQHRDDYHQKDAPHFSLTNETANIIFFYFHGFLFVYSALNFDQHFQRYWEGAEKMIRFEPDDLDLALCCALVVTQHDRNGLQQVKSYASEKDTKVRFRIHQKWLAKMKSRSYMRHTALIQFNPKQDKIYARRR